MIEIKPTIQHHSNCPYCRAALKPQNLLWQGMHIGVECSCVKCNTEFIDELRVGHASFCPYIIDRENGVVLGDEIAKGWWGNPFLQSIQNPHFEEIEISKEVFRECKRVILLNCIDYLYGDCLLKLITVQRHLDHHPEYGVVVIVQKFLRWMVPDGVAEVWTVDIPIKKGQDYYPSFNKFVAEESKRFNEIYVSTAHLRASPFDITRFSGVPKYSFEQEEFKITFVWREDRLWWGNFFLFQVLRKLKLLPPALLIQNWKVRRLFDKIRSKVPSAKFAVVGLGNKTKFPGWIEDYRTDRLDDEKNKEICQVSSESRLVIGIQGSAMLKPSGHAGMTIVLTPKEKWGNLGHDILFQEPDPRLSFYRYQYFPSSTRVTELAIIASEMVLKYSKFSLAMNADKPL
jgi:hypothetical protein